MNQYIKDIIKAYDQADRTQVHQKLNLLTTMREQVEKLIKEISKQLP
jgi:hypothetical protein